MCPFFYKKLELTHFSGYSLFSEKFNRLLVESSEHTLVLEQKKSISNL